MNTINNNESGTLFNKICAMLILCTCYDTNVECEPAFKSCQEKIANVSGNKRVRHNPAQGIYYFAKNNQRDFYKLTKEEMKNIKSITFDAVDIDDEFVVFLNCKVLNYSDTISIAIQNCAITDEIFVGRFCVDKLSIISCNMSKETASYILSLLHPDSLSKVDFSKNNLSEQDRQDLYNNRLQNIMTIDDFVV